MTIAEAMRRTSGGAAGRDEMDPLLGNPEQPDVTVLQREFEDSWAQATDTGRLAAAENIRYNRWPGQTDDGLKHQDQQGTAKEPVRPWNKSADTRVKLVDNAINWIVDILLAAFWNSRPKVSATYATTLTAMQQSEWRKIISWVVHGPLRGKLVDEVELAAQVGHTLGSVVLKAQWRQEHGQTLQSISFKQVEEMIREELKTRAQQGVQNNQPTIFEEFLAAVQDPTQEARAVQMLTGFFTDLKPARARRAVRDLRNTGAAEFPVPKVIKNEPDLRVLIQGLDFFLPVEATADIDAARATFELEWMSIGALEAMEQDGPWDPAFIAAAKLTAGSRFPAATAGNPDERDINGRLVMIVHAHHRQRDEDGVPGTYKTVICPGVPELYGAHELVEYPRHYPYVLYRTEATDRRPDGARGLPESHGVDQAEIKKQRDALFNLSDLTVLPMFRRRGGRATGVAQEFGPGGFLNDPTGSIEAITMPPGKPDLAFALIEAITKSADEYVGRPRPDVAPTPGQLRQQRMANRWLLTWAEVLWQLGVMAYQYLTPEELESLLGHPPLLTRELLIQHRVILWFDVRSLDSEWTMEVMKVVGQYLLTADSAGSIDRSKYVHLGLSYLDPTLAEEVTVSKEGASQAIFKEVRDEIAQMAQGNEAIYTKNDPAAEMKLEFAAQIVAANPTYGPMLKRGAAVVDQKLAENPPPELAAQPAVHQKLVQDGRFAFLFQKYVANLDQSMKQEKNKQTGELGVEAENQAAG